MYYDLCLEVPSSTSDTTTRESLATLLALGYTTIARNRSPAVEGRISEADRCSLTPVPDGLLITAGAQHAGVVVMRQWDCLASSSCPAPACAPLAAGEAGSTSHRPVLQQLSRLSFRAGEPVQCEALAAGSAITSGYDLLALQPTSERTLQQACTSLDLDIITFNACEKLPFKLRPATLRPALTRGIMFEVCYGAALHSSAARVMFISNTQALARCTRGRNILLSSGASSSEDVRSPHAASSLLASILDVPASKACAALTHNAAAAVARGAARRSRAVLGSSASMGVQGAGGGGGKAGKKVQVAMGYKPGQDLPRVPIVMVGSRGQGRGQAGQRPGGLQGGAAAMERDVPSGAGRKRPRGGGQPQQ